MLKANFKLVEVRRNYNLVVDSFSNGDTANNIKSVYERYYKDKKYKIIEW